MRLLVFLLVGFAVVACSRSSVREKRAAADEVRGTGLCRGIPLPTDQHFVAEGLCANLVAAHQGALREITFAPNGDLLGVTIDGAIRRFRDANKNGFFDPGPPEIVDIANTSGDNGQNCHLEGDLLYCGSQDGVKRWKYSPDLAALGSGEDVMIGQPGGGNHPMHPVHVYDQSMYVDSGSERNTMSPMPADYDTHRAVIKRFDLARFVPGKPFRWDDGEIFVRGARNITGFTRDSHGRMYGVINGVDDLRYEGQDVHPDNPGEGLVILEQGQTYGWPFCFMAQRIFKGDKVVAPGTYLRADAMSRNMPNILVRSNKDDDWCAAHTTPPMSLLQAHTAPLDIVIFEGSDGGLPSRWRGGAFVSLHGSWNREPGTGYQVVWVPLDANGRAAMPTSTASETRFPYEVVFGGGRAGHPKDGDWSWSGGSYGETSVRPVGVAVSPVDGALYVSSDNRRPAKAEDGALYRIASATSPAP